MDCSSFSSSSVRVKGRCEEGWRDMVWYLEEEHLGRSVDAGENSMPNADN